MSYEEAREALKKGDGKRALALVKAQLKKQPDGEGYALAGLVCFRLERYGTSAIYYGKAVAADDSHPDWCNMRDLALANACAKIDVPIPKPKLFDPNKLLAPPADSFLPAPPEQRRTHGCFKRLCLYFGEVLGAVFTVLMNWLTDRVGRRFGYRAKVWTNWYGRPLPLEVLTLAYMRERLNAHNLYNSYPADTLVAFQRTDLPQPVGVERFRTADGSWNNLANPKEGAACTRFHRNVNPLATEPEDIQRLHTPDPRKVSLELLSRPTGDDGQPEMQEVPFLNLLAASWIQFMLHDWVNHGDVEPKDVISVQLHDGDPAKDRYLQDAITVGRTQADPTRNAHEGPFAANYINEVTHWWDASQIYGSDIDTQKRLRSRELGKMALNDDGTLPVDGGTQVEDAGFMRNWWVGMSMLHALFVREHNSICDMLHEANPRWDGDQLFNVARLINAAVMAKIHSIEWTPAILPNRALDTGLNVNWYGLLTVLTRKGKQRKTLSEINVRNAEIGGIVGNPIERHGCPFGLTEEFVEVYRLHSLLPERLELRQRGQAGVTAKFPFNTMRQRGSTRMTDLYAMSDLFYSFGKQHPGALRLNNYPRFMQELSVAGNPFFDVGTVDILRARERGVPRYNEFRRQLGLNPIDSFDELTDEPAVRKKLKSVYTGGVEDLDLLIGTLAESHRPTRFGFGETLFQIFILNASRRLQADRFYTDSYTEDVYTAEGLRWIDQTDLKTVLLRHYPELADTGLANIKNAFEPWDEGPELDPDRHPLREWDAELQPDPWRGDAYRHA